jgi:hypothetical protein
LGADGKTFIEVWYTHKESTPEKRVGRKGLHNKNKPQQLNDLDRSLHRAQQQGCWLPNEPHDRVRAATVTVSLGMAASEESRDAEEAEKQKN